MPATFWTLLGSATAALLLLMTGVWALSLRLRNAGIVDVAWAAHFALVAGYYALAAPGYPARRAVVAGMVALWSLRLAAHLAVRVAGHHPVEDGRYQRLRQEWAPHVEAKLLGFFAVQGLLNAVLSVPFLFPCLDPSPGLRPVEWAGLVLWIVAWIGESVADRQLAAFKADPTRSGRTCRSGLWRYSRHPNYFFEWLVWCAYALFASASPGGWVSAYCPLLMLYFLFRVTGIPATEEQALRTKGDDYRDYQRTTSAFVPWPPRRSPAVSDDHERRLA
jgi:steroid 5-alpha reductase family enzyme